MAKEIKRISFEIEHYNGSTYMGFMLSIKDDGTVDVVKTSYCSLADVDGDYIFDTENDLYRIQADEPISEYTYDEIWNYHEEHMKSLMGIRDITFDEFQNLKVGDIVFVKCGDDILESKVIQKPFYNYDADEPGWELETTNCFCDFYSLYVKK
jgi:hypothetical protein